MEAFVNLEVLAQQLALPFREAAVLSPDISELLPRVRPALRCATLCELAEGSFTSVRERLQQNDEQDHQRGEPDDGLAAVGQPAAFLRIV